MDELQRAIVEFYDPLTPYEKIRELDNQLTDFKKRADAFKICESLLLSTDDNIRWFSLSVYEETIMKHWEWIYDVRFKIKDMLLALLQHSETMSFRFRSKLVKAFIELAKRTWPEECPDLFSLIHTFIFDRTKRLTGLMLLKTMTEEFLSTKPDLPANVKKHLKDNFAQHIPSILMLSKQLLDTAFDSPNHHRTQSVVSSPVKADDSLVSILNTPISPPRGTFDEDTAEICRLAMDIPTIVFQTMPVVNYLNIGLADTILKYAQLNDAANVSLGVASLSTLTEVFEKQGFGGQISIACLVFKHLCEILKFLTASSNDDGFGDDLDEDYRMKMNEFCRAFIKNLYPLLERDPTIPSHVFLELYFKFTISSEDVMAFRDSVEVWADIMDFVQLRKNNPEVLNKFKGGLVDLAHQLFKRIRFDTNPSELSRVEDDNQNMNGETDFDLFLNEVLDVFVNIVELFPELINELFMFISQKKDALEQLFLHNMNPLSPKTPGSIKSSVLADHLFIDTRTILRIFQRLANIFCDTFEQTSQDVYSLVQLILQIDQVCMRLFDEYGNSDSFIKLFGECFASQQSFVHWLLKLKQSNEQAFDTLISDMIQASLAVLNTQAPERVSVLASRLFLSICDTVRPARLLQYPNVLDFFKRVHSLSLSKTDACKKNIYRSTSIGMIMTSNDEFVQFVNGLTIPFSQITPDVPKKEVYHILVVLSAMMDGIQNERLAFRQTLFDCVKIVIPKTLELFQLNDPELTIALLDFTISLFTCFKRPMENLKMYPPQLPMNFENEDLLMKYIELLRSSEDVVYVYNVCREVVESNTESAEYAKPTVFDLLHDIIISKWKVITIPNSPIGLQQLLALFMTTFRSPQIDLFQKNLHLFEDLNAKVKLFSHEQFNRINFLQVMIDVLVEKSHEIIRDEIVKVVYAIAKTNEGFRWFYQQFLGDYINARLSNDEHKVKLLMTLKANGEDYPTFVNMLNDFTNDLAYYRMK